MKIVNIAGMRVKLADMTKNLLTPSRMNLSLTLQSRVDKDTKLQL
jgi:hypothetical protein